MTAVVSSGLFVLLEAATYHDFYPLVLIIAVLSCFFLNILRYFVNVHMGAVRGMQPV